MVRGRANADDHTEEHVEAQGEKAGALREVAVKEAEADKARVEAKDHEAEQRTQQD